MAVSSVTMRSPFDGFDTSDLRPQTNITWAGGIAPFNVLYEWDTVDTFDSGSLLTDANNGVTSPDEGVPPSDLGPFATNWFHRVTVTDTDVDEIQSVFNDASGGDFTLSFDGQGPTSAINWNDSAANVKSALEGLSNITDVTVTGAGTSGDPWLVTFVDPGAQDVALMTADDTGLTGETVGTTIAQDTAGNTGAGVTQPSSSGHELSFTDPNDHARYLYVNHNIGLGFGGGGPDGEPDEFSRFLYLNHNVDANQPCPWLDSLAPSLQIQGGTVVLTGDSFGATQATYVTEIRLYETQDLLGGSYVTMAPTSWSDSEVTVTVPNGSSSGWVAVVHTGGTPTCDGSAFQVLNVTATEPDPLMGWWIQTVDKQNAVTVDSTILPYNVSNAGFKKIMGAVGSGYIEIPLSDPDLDAIVDPIMRKGVLIRVYLDNVFRYAFYGEKLSHVYVEEGVGVARITGRGMEVVAEWTKVLPHDFPASPTKNPTWIYGSNENFVLNPGFDDAVDDPILDNPGGEDGNDSDGNAEGWGASGNSLDSITAIQDSGFARTDDWYIKVAASDNHSGMTQSVPVTPNRVYHVQAYVKDETNAGMRVTLAIGGDDDISATATYPNNFEFGNEILAELDNVARNGAANGLPGGSTDGTWQVLDVEVLTGDEQTSLSITVQNDHHSTGIFVDFGVDDVTIVGWGLGLDPWEAYLPLEHSNNSFQLDRTIAFDGSTYSIKVNPVSAFAGIQQIISLNPNAKYTFSAWLHTVSVSAGDTWRLVARLNDGNETFIGNTADIEPGVGVWTNFTFVATMPNIEDVEIILRFAYTGPNNPGTVHMDSFAAVPGEPPSSAGTIVNDILDAMNAAGKLLFLQRTWTGNVDSNGDPDTDLDSNGKPWPSLLSLDIKPTESLLSVLSRLTALGHEWEIVPVDFIEGGDTGFELNLYTARPFNSETGIGTSHVNDVNGPVITPSDAIVSGQIVKTAFNTNTIFAIGDDGVWSSSEQFPYETGDIPAGDPAPLGYRESFGIIEEVITVSASDTTTISKYADARLADEKGKESQLQLQMQRASVIRPFLHFGVGDSMFIDMPPDNPNPLDETTGLRKNPQRIRAISATLGGEGADVSFVIDANRVMYEDQLAWLAMIAQLAERSPAEQTGQGTGTVSGTGGVVSIIGGSTITAPHQHKLGSSEITDRTVSGDISGTLPGPLNVNKVKGMAVSNTIPTDADPDSTLLVYDYDLNQWVPETVPGGGAGADTDAIHDNVSGEIAAVADKAVPVDADFILIEDSENSDVKKSITIGNLPGGSSPALDDITDVTLDAPATNEVLAKSAGDWINRTLAEAGISDTSHTIVSHDTDATGAELTELTDASETTLHSHAGGSGDPLTTKGDIMAYDTDADRVPIGTDDYVLTADSTTAFGLKWAEATGGGSSASTPLFDLLHSMKSSVDTPDDEFDSGTLDGKWTAVSGSSGTVDPFETGEVEKYDLTSRPGWLLLQAGSAADQKVELRQDFTIPDGESIVVALAFGGGASDGNTGIAVNEQVLGISLNDNDTTYNAGNFVYFVAQTETDGSKMSIWNGSSVNGASSAAGTQESGQLFFMRITRVGTTYKFWRSFTGVSWQAIGQETALTPTNLWVFAESINNGGEPVPIHSVAWIRQGTNNLDPWNPIASVTLATPATLMFDLLHSTKTTADTPDDEFDETTLDGKWTVVGGATLGTVDLTGGPSSGNAIYDLTSRPGWLLTQGNNSGVALRQDHTLADGASIVVAVSEPVVFTGDNTMTNNNSNVTIGINDTDSGLSDGIEFNMLLETDGNSYSIVVVANGSVTGRTSSASTMGTYDASIIFLRITRETLTYGAWVSFDGTAWSLIDEYTVGTALTNIWISGFTSIAGTPTPIQAFAWVRQGTNDLDPWNPVAAVAISGGSPLTTKGDVFTFDDDVQRLGVGIDDQVLTVDSTEDTGLKWADATGGGAIDTSSAVAARMYATADQTLTGTVEAEVDFDTTLFASPPSAVSLSDNAFVAPVDGTYEIQCCFHYDTTSVDFRVEVAIDDVVPTNASFLAKRDIAANRAIVGSIMVEMSAGEKATFLVKANTGGDLRGASVGVETWASFKLVDNTGQVSLMFDLLHSKKTSADTPDDEFDETTLDGKWTVVAGSTGTVDLLETGNVDKYDLTTRPSWLLMQAGNDGVKEVSLRQDYTLPDGTSIVIACSWPTPLSATGPDTGNTRISLGINDNDTSINSGDHFQMFMDTSVNEIRLRSHDGSNVALSGNGVPPVGGMMFLRMARSGTTYFASYSVDGTSWSAMGSSTITTGNNIWIGADSVTSNTNEPVPIVAVAWIRQGTNDLDPWNPTAAVAVSAGGWEDWIDVAGGIGFVNSWVNFGSGLQDAEYRKHSNGMVHIRGMIKSGTVAADAFVLPSGYRPATEQIVAVVQAGSPYAWRGDIETDGGVQLYTAGNNVYFSFNLQFDSTGGS